MSFDSNQPSYQALRKIFAERTKGIVLFCGAGLSRSAGVPSWLELRDKLADAAKRHLSPRVAEEIKIEQKLLDLAIAEQDLWRAFQHLKRLMGETTYHAEMRLLFPDSSVPKIYESLWDLPAVDGCITLNIDGFLTRAFAAVFGGKKSLTNFCGIDFNRHQDVLNSGNRFLVNLHGIISDVKSWIFTTDEKESLYRDQAYLAFLRLLFGGKTVVFIGVTADDEAIATHLAYLKSVGFKGGDHFWITNRADAKTISWAEAHGIRVILYTPAGKDHVEVDEMVSDLLRYKPTDSAPPPVLPSTKRERGLVLPPPEVLEEKSAEEIRQTLNKEASRLLSSGADDRFEQYAVFWKRYDEAIHRAWSTSTTPPRNVFMGMAIEQHIKKGGFGTIYSATNETGRALAVKILHNAAKDDPTVLQSFRRGVQAMRILSLRKIDGIVPYEAAWEIPPCAVMEYIDGPNLHEAVSAGRVKDWKERIGVALEITLIIRAAHSVPEGVLHRDVRPANIMLCDLWSDPDSYKVYVLDFDLAWHKDATGHSISITHAVNGYLAPELTSEKSSHTRSALVDSYGIGMTLFYMAAARSPLFSESSFSQWEQSLNSEIMHQSCAAWRSIPHRWIRLVFWATRPNQNERWDVGRIYGALVQMKAAIGGPANVLSAELFAEEVLARSQEGARIYSWDVDRLVGSFELRTGFRVEIRGDESEKEVSFSCDWMNTGDREFGSVKKYIKPAADAVESALKTGGWVVDYRDFLSGSVHVTAKISVAKLRKNEGLQAAVKAVNDSIEELKIS